MNYQWPAAVFLIIFATMLTLGAYTPAQAATNPNQRITVHMGHYRFEPNKIETTLGRILEITLINEDKITPHNFTLKAKEAGLDIDTDIGGGKTKTVRITPTKTGSYIFYCNKKLPFMKSHRMRGIEGTLLVR